MYKFTRQSYYLEMLFNDTLVSSATGFFFMYAYKSYFITNKHNVTGKNPDTSECINEKASIPNQMIIYEPITNQKIVTLAWDELSPELSWQLHEDESVDIAIKEIEDEVICQNIAFVDLFCGEEWLVTVTERVAIVGYPFGKIVSTKIPTYITGHLATDLVLDYDNKPLFLVDARTRAGQSGSPVYYFCISGTAYNTKEESMDVVFGNQEKPGIEKFLGIYSGRINKDSDLGKVWKKTTIFEVLDKQER